MANRRFGMYQYRNVLVRMRLGDSDRKIAKAHLMGRRKAAELRTGRQARLARPEPSSDPIGWGTMLPVLRHLMLQRDSLA